MNRPAIPRAILTVVAIAVLAGCAAQTPEERVAALRADYEASLNSFQVLEEPLEPAPVPADDPAAEADAPSADDSPPAGTAAATAPDEATAAPVAVRQDVLLDIVVRNLGDDRLPGLTLDIEQADSAGQPKANHRLYLDTSTLGPGAERAVSHRLQDVDYTTGDGFHVEIRQAIPPDQRSEYREFSEIVEQP